MGRVLRFIILIVVGFGLGAGLAWFQKSNQIPAAPVIAEQPAADTAMMAADQNAMMAPDANAPDQAAGVAGSEVGGAFSLTDHNGVSVTDQSWPGKMKLVFFGFTACPDICPLGLDKMTTALNTLGLDAAQIQPLFITVDPARDNMAALQSYLANYHPSILGLTGTEEEIKVAESAYKVYAMKGEAQEGGHYSVDHSGYIYLMSDDNRLLEIFGSDATAESMVGKIQPHLNAAASTTEGGAGEMAAPVTEESTPAETVEPAPAAEETPAATEGYEAEDSASATEETTVPAEDATTPAEEVSSPAEESPATEAPVSEDTFETTPSE